MVIVAGAGFAGSGENGNILVFETGGIHFGFFLAFHIKNQDFPLRHVFLSRHGVFICFQGGTGLGHGVDHPQVVDFPFITADHGEFFGVVGPDDIDRLPLAFVFFFIHVGLPPSGAGVAVMFFSILGELMFFDFFVFLVFQVFFIIDPVHPEKIVIACEHDDAFVGRDIGPVGLFRFFFIIFQQVELSVGQGVFKIKNFFLGLLFFLAFFYFFFFLLLNFLFLFFYFLFLGTFHLKADGGVLFDEFDFFNRQMLGFIWIFG